MKKLLKTLNRLAIPSIAVCLLGYSPDASSNSNHRADYMRECINSVPAGPGQNNAAVTQQCERRYESLSRCRTQNCAEQYPPSLRQGPPQAEDSAPRQATDPERTAPAQTTAGNGSGLRCRNVRLTYSGGSAEPIRFTNFSSLPERMTVEQCQQLTSRNWEEVTVQDGGRSRVTTEQVWEGAFVALINKANQELNNKFVASEIASVINNYAQLGQRLARSLTQCEAFRSVTGFTPADSGSERTQTQRRGTSRGNQRASADGQITCRSCGPQTQDYNACVSAVNAYDVALVGQAGFSGYQQLSYMDTTADIQANLRPDDAAAPLRGQEQALRAQSGLMQNQATVDGAKAATFVTMMNRIPTPEELVERCVQDGRRANAVDLVAGENTQIGRLYQKYISSFQTLMSSAEANAIDPQNADQARAQQITRCLAASNGASGNGGAAAQVNLPTAANAQAASSTNLNALRRQCQQAVANDPCVLQNQQARDKMKAAAIASGLEALVNAAKAALLARQANKVGDLVEDVEGFSPQALNFQEDFFGSECELNPAADGCDGFVDKRSYDFGAGEPLQIHGLDRASSIGGRLNDDLPDGVNDAGSSSTDRSGVNGPVGSIDPGKKEGGSFTDRIPGAATVRSGGGSGGGGGAPGGAAGAGGIPQGAGGRGGAADAPRMASPKAIGNTYDGGSGSLRFGGGGGLNRRPAGEDGAENPFANMFKNGEGPQDGTLNFRDTASNEDIAGEEQSIFAIITNRYGAVQKSDRLLKYERGGDE